MLFLAGLPFIYDYLAMFWLLVAVAIQSTQPVGQRIQSVSTDLEARASVAMRPSVLDALYRYALPKTDEEVNEYKNKFNTKEDPR